MFFFCQLKVKYTKEKRKPSDEKDSSVPPPEAPPTNDDVITSAANENAGEVNVANQVEANANLVREQERCRGLEDEVEELTKKMAEEERQRMSIEKQMRDEIRRLHRELRLERENNKRGHCRLFITARPASDRSAEKSR